jgi:hypothetical protein
MNKHYEHAERGGSYKVLQENWREDDRTCSNSMGLKLYLYQKTMDIKLQFAIVILRSVIYTSMCVKNCLVLDVKFREFKIQT